MEEKYVFDVLSLDEHYKGCILVAERMPSGEWMSWMYNGDGMLMGYHTSGFRTLKKLLDAFARHRPTCMLEIRKEGR